jgi:uncharacterized protein
MSPHGMLVSMKEKKPFCADDTEWTFVGDQTLKGKEAVRQYMATTYIEPPKFTVTHLIAEGDFVTALGDITLKDKGGKAVHHTYCDVWRFHGDKIIELKAFVIKTEVQHYSTSEVFECAAVPGRSSGN